jgi:hypothetical protein
VLVVGGPAVSSNTDVAPAVITRCWGAHPDGGEIVNVCVFPDAGISPAVTATSVRLFDTEAEARALLPSTAAYWPPRV